MKERTQAQRLQARINGAKSRGPSTPEGKEASSRNAVKHGLRSEKILSEAEQPIYKGRRDAYVEAEPEEPAPRRLHMLEVLAMATVQVEIACSLRNASAERRAREIVEEDQAQLYDLFESAAARHQAEPSVEGMRLHRYMQSAINTVVQMNKALDAEHDREWRRRWKEGREGVVGSDVSGV